MSGIEELQQRVIEAEERFGLARAERAKYSGRLMKLIDTIETRLGDQKAEIERQSAESASQAEELETLRLEAGDNKLLRGTIQSLLNAIELGNDMALNETMQALEIKISALVGDAGAEMAVETNEAEAPGIEAAETPEEESAAPEIEAEAPEPETAEAPEEESAAAEIEAEAPEPEIAEAPEEESAAPEIEAEAPEPEATPETSEDLAAEETPAELEEAAEPEAVAETGETEVIDIPAGDSDITIIDEELVLGAADDSVPLEADAIEENPTADAVEEGTDAVEEGPNAVENNLVGEAEAGLEVPAAAEAGAPGSEASSLEDIMRRVSKLVEEEGALGPLTDGGVQAEVSAPEPEAAEEQKSASG